MGSAPPPVGRARGHPAWTQHPALAMRAAGAQGAQEESRPPVSAFLTSGVPPSDLGRQPVLRGLCEGCQPGRPYLSRLGGPRATLQLHPLCSASLAPGRGRSRSGAEADSGERAGWARIPTAPAVALAARHEVLSCLVIRGPRGAALRRLVTVPVTVHDHGQHASAFRGPGGVMSRACQAPPRGWRVPWAFGPAPRASCVEGRTSAFPSPATFQGFQGPGQ